MNRLLMAALLAATALPVPVMGQTLFLNDAVLAPGDRSETSDVVIVDGVVADVSASLDAPQGAQVIEGAWLTPGLFASDTTLGLIELGSESGPNDSSATAEVASIDLRAADAYNPRSPHIAISRRQGITHAVTLPRPGDDTIFGGMAAVVDLSGSFDSVTDDRAALHIALGEGGSRRAGGSRTAALAQLRAALDDAERGIISRDRSNLLTRIDASVLSSVIDGSVPLAARASRASDIMGLARLLEDYPSLDIIVYGAEEAHLVADELSGSGIKFVVDPLQNLPDNFQSTAANSANFDVLKAAGLDVAIANTSSLGVTKAQALRQHAGNAVARGTDWEDAFAAISSVPAEWFGVSDLGLVVWDGDPLEVTSAPLHMVLDGETLSLASRQTLLRDRYNPAIQDERPHKYR